MKREPRNPEIKFKPAVVSWFKSSPEAKSYFDHLNKNNLMIPCLMSLSYMHYKNNLGER